MDKAESERRKEASQHLVKALRANAKSKGESTPGGFPSKVSGAYSRSFKYKLNYTPYHSAVGSRDPKAHLLEYGHIVKTRGEQKKGITIVKPRPLIFPTFRAEADALQRILSRRWF